MHEMVRNDERLRTGAHFHRRSNASDVDICKYALVGARGGRTPVGCLLASLEAHAQGLEFIRASGDFPLNAKGAAEGHSARGDGKARSRIKQGEERVDTPE